MTMTRTTVGRRKPWTYLTALLASAVLIVGLGAPAALAKGKPGGGPPGVPPGQPFQALQKEIDALAARVTTLEAAAPQPGLMWINPLDLRAATSAVALDATGPGLDVTSAGAGSDVVQVGLQVPLGYAVTGVRVCSVSGTASSYVSSVQLLQYAATPTTPPALLASGAPGAPGASTLTCFDTTPIVGVDPSAGGAMFLSLGITFTAADTVVVRAVGVHLEPVP
jgi:hypothetical protein